MNASDFAAWETHAQWWQDGFTDGADPEYEDQIKPIVRTAFAEATRVLEVGTGEGQLARVIAERECTVVGVDPAHAQLATARARAGGVEYAHGAVGALPFADGAFDGVLACLVFEHVRDLAPAMGEVARVLAPGGRLLVILNHPLLQAPDSGWIDDQILGEQYWRIGPYLPEDIRLETLDKGVELPFVHRPTSMYLHAMFAHGFVLDGFEEPAPTPAFLARAPEYAHQAAFPRILVLHAQKHA
ncbi:MAG: class I SAM-dependent methyltransferase [Acidimicrobiia bacterium]